MRRLITGAFASLITVAITIMAGVLPQAQAAQAATARVPAPRPSSITIQQTTIMTGVTVRPGDSLTAIAARLWGSASLWPSLWWLNRQAVRDPDVITAGQQLVTSPRPVQTAAIVSAAMAALPHYTVPAPAAAPAAAPVQLVSYSSGGFEACVISRESGGNPEAVNPSSGAGGLFQFLPSTWAALGFAAEYPGGAQTAPVSVQEAAFAKAYAESGTSPWSPYDGC